MEKEVVKHHHHQPHNHHLQLHNNNNNTSLPTNSISLRERHIIGEGVIKTPHSPDFDLRWGSQKRLRCMKTPVYRVDRRVVKSDNGNFNLRQRAVSPAQPLHHRVLRNTENGSAAMKGQQRGLASPETDRGEKKGIHHENTMVVNNGTKTTSCEKGGASPGGSEVVVWPPKFVIALTNKEKEEDFMAIKGSKLPQRPKKRAKFVQRYLNLVSPGGWLCDLTLDRYEVREKKITKKQRPRGLKAMGNYIDSDSD